MPMGPQMLEEVDDPLLARPTIVTDPASSPIKS